jgi:hypothetical protein
MQHTPISKIVSPFEGSQSSPVYISGNVSMLTKVSTEDDTRNDTDTGNRSTRRKICHTATFYATNLTFVVDEVSLGQVLLKSSSYLTDKTGPLHYKNQSDNTGRTMNRVDN